MHMRTGKLTIDVRHPGGGRLPLEGVERLITLSSFFMGSLVGGQAGSRWGDKRRSWLITTTLIQAALLAGAAGVLLAQPKPLVVDWTWGPAVLTLVSIATQR